jgi:formyltetrahydrofolate synthetase
MARKLNLKNPVPSDIEIAQSIEPIPILEVAKSVGISESELDLYGRYKAKV